MSAGVLYYSLFFSHPTFLFSSGVSNASELIEEGHVYDRTLALNKLFLHAFQGDDSTLQTLVFTHMAYDRQYSGPRHSKEERHGRRLPDGDLRGGTVAFAGRIATVAEGRYPRFGMRWNNLAHIENILVPDKLRTVNLQLISGGELNP